MESVLHRERKIMLKWCVDKWFANKEGLRRVLETDESLKNCEYLHLMELVVEHILNQKEEENSRFDSAKITKVDQGDWQGTILFFIPRKTYEPNAGDYLLTYIEYGSCPLCDVLEKTKDGLYDNKNKKQSIDDFMIICKELVCNITKPYNTGWHEDKRFIAVAGQKELCSCFQETVP